MINVFKGDQYAIHCIITMGEGEEEREITPDDIEDVELILGCKSKTYSDDGGVTYEDGEWLFNFTQKESFCFKPNEEMHGRVKMNGEIYGLFLGVVNVSEIATRREL